MRIITGKYKGRRLFSPRGESIRPATDRAKGSIFNSLQSRISIDGMQVLDLFAGTGSLGFEALSRGASAVTFVDDSRSALDVIERNARDLDCLDQCTVICADAFSFVEQGRGEYGLVFADPPYPYEKTTQLPAAIFGRQLLERGGFLIIEHAKRTSFEPSPLYRISAQKEFGNTRLSFFAHSA